MSQAKLTTLSITALTPAGVSAATLRRWALAARRRLRLPGRISVVILPPAQSKKLNTQYRQRARATNVLSFDYAHSKQAQGHDVDGEVLLCPVVIRREARVLGESYRGRLKMLLEHGMIHLLGFDHHTAAEQRHWERIERKLL